MNTVFKTILSKIGHLRIINQMMLIYIIGGLIPLLIVSFVLSTNTREIMIDTATSEAETNSVRVEDRFLEVFELASDVSDSLYLDAQLVDLITSKYDSDIDLINALNSYNRIDNYLNLYTEIDSIRIYIHNTNLLDNSQIIKLTIEDIKSQWYNKAVNANGKMALTYKYDPYKRQEYLALVRLLIDSRGESLGVMVINISEEYLQSIIKLEPYEFYMVLDDAHVIFASDEEVQRSDVFGSDLMTHYTSLPEGSNNFSYGETRYRILIHQVPIKTIKNSLKLITAIPVSELTKTAATSTSTSVIFIILSAIVSMSLVYTLSRAFSNKINSFRKDLHQVAGGDFSIQSDIGGNDELGQLSNDLNIMVNSIQNIIHDAYVVQLQKEQLASKQKDAQFKMLASQINPHFLYNSLETIRMKAHINGQKEIANVVKKLAKIMRHNLSIPNDEVTLKSELDLIRNYLEIQQFRFRDKVTFGFDICCNPVEFKVLPLLLQPLVENAFIHGLENKIGQGHIEVRVTNDDKNLVISVADDGVGMDKNTLKKVQLNLHNEATSIDGSIGLTNVSQRLKIYYGSQYGLEIVSVKGEGTTINMVIPILAGGNEDV